MEMVAHLQSPGQHSLPPWVLEVVCPKAVVGNQFGSGAILRRLRLAEGRTSLVK